jgi:apolipoprotein D and lipocalin family protein
MKRETRWIVLSAIVASVVSAAVAVSLVRRRAGRGNFAVPKPSKSVELSRYLGVWYEVGRYENRFERGCEFVTAEYRSRGDRLLEVINTCRHPDKSVRRVSHGRARVVPGSSNARLEVSFGGPWYLGNYWILDHADDYSWSIVGEPSGRYLWILSRTALSSPGEIEWLKARARTMGYDLSRFRLTRQV